MPNIDLTQLSPADALDLAILVEEESRSRYEEFARIVGGRYRGDASDMFRTMAGYEAQHARELAQRRTTLFGNIPRRVTAEMIEDVEAPDRGEPRVFMSARQAMEVALRAEEKAYDFFTAALKQVTHPGVRELFEELRQEEVRHRDLVRAAMEKLPVGPDVEDDEADEPGSDAG